MKKFIGLLSLMLVALSFSFYSCQNKTTNTNESHTSEMGVEYSSSYVCPMHCEGSGSEQKGICPVCGMDYVKLEDHISNGHDHVN